MFVLHVEFDDFGADQKSRYSPAADECRCSKKMIKQAAYSCDEKGCDFILIALKSQEDTRAETHNNTGRRLG
ncbi:hypothetical protein ACFL6N_05110 [Thermodesulfobacteriota bacterium]